MPQLLHTSSHLILIGLPYITQSPEEAPATVWDPKVPALKLCIKVKVVLLLISDISWSLLNVLRQTLTELTELL